MRQRAGKSARKPTRLANWTGRLRLGPSLAQTDFELSVMGQTGILAASKMDLYKTEFAYSAFLDRLPLPDPLLSNKNEQGSAS